MLNICIYGVLTYEAASAALKFMQKESCVTEDYLNKYSLLSICLLFESDPSKHRCKHDSVHLSVL